MRAIERQQTMIIAIIMVLIQVLILKNLRKVKMRIQQQDHPSKSVIQYFGSPTGPVILAGNAITAEILKSYLASDDRYQVVGLTVDDEYVDK